MVKYYTLHYPPEITSKGMAITQLEVLNLVHMLTYLLPPNPHEYEIKMNTHNLASQQVL